jgi:hypothetical protein
MDGKELMYLDEAVGAWNVDGSSDALAESGSWLRDAEEATGRRRGRCSFEGCPNLAEVGGHVWISQEGCFIAPICKPCNRHDNQDRMQGAGARLRGNIEVTRTGMTEGMRTATRRIAGGDGGRRRRCESCNDDISDRPASHTSCLECWSGGGSGRRGGGSYGRGARRRRCESCNEDISDRPPSHTLCLECWSGGGSGGRGGERGGRGGRRRLCESCNDDISDRPPSHSLCLGCWSGSRRSGGGRNGRGGGRVCEGCGVSIAGAPTTHYLCRNCF